MPIRIAADLTIVTLRTNGQELQQRATGDYAQSVLQRASTLLKRLADIEFAIGKCETVVEEMPAGARADVVDEAGYHYLAAAHRAGDGVRVLFVDRADRPELGGEAREATRVCLIVYEQDPAPVSRMLAHELGHLLGLPHIDRLRRPGPGQERQVASWMRNLMYSGALSPTPVLTPDQVRSARASALAQRFRVR
jgi:hypothetical protein